MDSKIIPQVIEEEMKQAYVDYAMSVIVGRALPDARDGLKPVHRRILYGMQKIGLFSDKPSRKSAHITGEVMGKYHPHGNAAIYEAMVRMAQDFSMRGTLIDGQGNFGCFTGDTKVKLTDGRDITFRQLVEEKDKMNYTYTVNEESLIEIAQIKNPRLTKQNAEIMKVVLDNNEEIKCTLNHKFMLRNGTYKEAQELKPGDSLMPLNLKLSSKEDNVKPALIGYQMVYQPAKNEWIGCHVLADQWNLKNRVYTNKAGKIRHHIDFNKLNNNPENIKRIPWGHHWKLHAEHASEQHKDPRYRKKIAEGRKKFWSDKKNRQINAERLSERNKKNWQNPNYSDYMRKVLSRVNTEYVKKHPESRKEKSNRLKKLWENQEYKEMMSDLKSKEMKSRWENSDPSLRKFSSEESKQMWSRQEHRDLISRQMKELWQDDEYKMKRREDSKKLWADKNYRSKFPHDHFSNMAKKLWSNPEIKKLHHKKAVLQWQNQEFMKRLATLSRERGRQRSQENPNLMKEMTEKAIISLRKKWQDPSYKEMVMKARILNFVNLLIKKYTTITPTIYEKERKCNIPRIESALKYFNDFPEIINQAKLYNHKVVRTEVLNYREDVFDLTIERTHNFALSSGIFVHNSIDGDPPAAERYTEARLSKLGEEMLADIDKETVDFVPNYDNTEKEPSVLPSKVPNLLVNGSTGIAVGMATNIPTHNLKEVCNAVIMLIDKPETEADELIKIIPGPDFPTGATIMGRLGIEQAYKTGHGKITVKANADIERDRIIMTEIPYMLNKAQLIEEIADHVRAKRIEGIRNIRDESNKEGIRVVIELKSNADGNVVLNQLYKYSRMKTTFSIRFLALVDNVPRILTLKGMLQEFIRHRQIVVRRRTQFELNKAEERAHILEGLIIALDNIDDIVKGIRASNTIEDAANFLMNNYKLSDKQTKAILDMRLQKLANLEQQSIRNEQNTLVTTISELKSILASEQKIFDIIKKEIKEIMEKYGDNRKTKIIPSEEEEFEIESIIEDKEVIVTITHAGYIKRIDVGAYRSQRRGGYGVTATDMKDEDWVEDLFAASTHSSLLFFTNKGQLHQIKVYEIPEGSRQAKGKPIVNLLSLDENEKVTAFVPVKEFKGFIFMATRKGTVKKTDLILFAKPRKGGVRAITLDEGDELIGVQMTDGTKQIILATRDGVAVRFSEVDVRSIGRSGSGVRGIRLETGDEVVSMEVADESKTLLTVTSKGFGKRTEIKEYRLIGRGGKGVTNINLTEKNGKVIGVKTVVDTDELMFITKKGIAIRTSAKDVSVIGRVTQGVIVMRLDDGDELIAVERIVNGE